MSVMLRGLRVCTLLAVLALVPAGCRPEPDVATTQDVDAVRDAPAIARAIAQDLLEVANLPGLSIALSRDGAVVFAEGFGYADVARQRPVIPATQFRAASVSKVIAATGLAKLLEQNALDLDAPIQRYLPRYPRKAWPVTARQLAGHLAGVPHYSAADRIERRYYGSVEDALSVFSHIDLQFEPGTKYSYSTHGFTLLAAVMEAAAGKPFLEYMKQSVFAPLGLHATGPDLRARSSPTMAELYTLDNGVLTVVAQPEDPSYKWAGGGLVSTPTDLVRMASAYFDGFITPAVRTTMFSSQKLASGAETGVGIGWRISRDMSGREVFEHAGSMEGARSVISLFPDDRLAISIMVNRQWNSAIEETAHTIALLFLTAAAPVAQPAGAAQVTVQLASGNGQTTSVSGQLSLNGRTGALSVDAGASGRQTLRLVYLDRDNIYALITPDGVLHMTLDAAAGMVRGRAIRYRSPMLTPPADEPPFLTLEGRLTAS